MPSFAFMKFLESTPERYDRGIMILSRGRITEVYEEIAQSVGGEGNTVLDIGCGTGSVSVACASRGSDVTGIDLNSGMLEVARRKASSAGLGDKARFLEMGAAEIGIRFSGEIFDACVSCLVFSELSEDEQRFVLSAAYSILRPGGMVIVAGEVLPENTGRRILNALVAAPSRLLTLILAQATTRPLKDLEKMLLEAGFSDIQKKRMWNDTFTIVKGTKGVQ